MRFLMRPSFAKRVLAAIGALAMASCLSHAEVDRLARSGPRIDASLAIPSRPASVGDEVLLVLAADSAGAQRLRDCVATEVEARLPAGVTLVVREPAQALAWQADGERAAGALRPWSGASKEAWLVIVHDLTESTTGEGPIVSSGIPVGRRGMIHRLVLQGTIWDLRGRRRLGDVTARFETESGAYLLGSNDITLPGFVLVRVRPAATEAEAICVPFARALAETLGAAWRAAANPSPPNDDPQRPIVVGKPLDGSAFVPEFGVRFPRP
jgi:hypothetical protein